MRNKRERIEEMQALARLMGEPAGRRWMRQVLSECHIWHTSMATNAIRMAFLEGERSQGLRLMTEAMEANPEMFLQMLKEGTNERPGNDNTAERGFGRDEPLGDDGA